MEDDNKIAITPIESLERETEAVFSDEDSENLGRCTKNEENTDDDDDLPLSKVSFVDHHRCFIIIKNIALYYLRFVLKRNQCPKK